MSFRPPITARLALTLMVASLAVTAGLGRTAARADDDAGVEFYEKKVRPVLAAHCYECHGPDKQEAGLQVDSVAAILRGGDQGAAIVPGDPDESLIVKGIKYDDLDFQMPPKQKLADADIAAIVEWIKQGAPAPKDEARQAAAGPKKGFNLAERKKHWCFQPLSTAAPPAVKNDAWIRGDIDRYILAKLEAADLAPAPEADSRTLIRRLYFDLTGLPPTPAEVEEFVKHFSPSPSLPLSPSGAEDKETRRGGGKDKAYEALVDKLLASPHFGERWARHWLDLVRYAETRGHEFDYLIPNAYRYRDYVIRAFNDDVPYDRFVVEHLAGDLMPKPRLDARGANLSILGTGFWFLGEECHSPVDIRQDETDRVDNKIDVMSKTFLGLTLACARCHDHKFDAISTKDYYALSGYVLGMSYRQTAFEADLHNRKIYDEVRRLEEKHGQRLRIEQFERLQTTLIQVDQYLLATRRAWAPGISEQAPLRRQASIAEAAGFFHVDPEQLRLWVDYFISPASKTGPLALWREFVETKRLPEWLTNPAAGPIEAGQSPRVIVDFARPEAWLADGLAWGDGPRPLGSVQVGLDARHPLRRVATANAAAVDPQWDVPPDGATPNETDAGRLNWRQTGRTLKTPTFVLESGKLRYRIRGSAKVYAAVASHRVNNGPLHGKLAKSFAGGDEWRWVEHDLSEYAGRRVHLEFTPFDSDELKANQSPELSVRGVVEERPGASGSTAWDFGDTDRYSAEVQGLRQTLRIEELTKLGADEQAEAIAAELKKLLIDEARNVLLGHDQSVGPTMAAAVDWMLSYDGLWSNPREPSSEVAAFFVERNRLRSQLRPSSPTAPAAWEGTAVDEHVLIRGNHRTEGDMVPRRFLEAFDGPAVASKEPGRLELAERIVNGRDPLPARVMVNRLWQHLLGRGIVRTVDNFGVMGEQPTHPELLDHLAREFMADGWSVKRAIRRIVLSSTYRMASWHADETDGPRVEKVDPQNNLFHRANEKRLEGEIVRDALLAVSGRLDPKLGGPSVEVYLTPFMEGRGRPASGPLDGAGRRSIYLRVRRNFLNPMFQAFDYPTPFTSVGRRSTSNVPAQALALMNGPLVVELAKQWAERMLNKIDPSNVELLKRHGYEITGDGVLRGSRTLNDIRIIQLYHEAFSRAPTTAERAAANAFVAEQSLLYGTRDEDLRVWADLCHVLFNAKEFIYIQ